MIEKILEKLDKYENLERESWCEELKIVNLIGECLTDLNELLKAAKEKKKACCEKKAGKQIIVTTCKGCPYSSQNDSIQDFCGHEKFTATGGHYIERYDIIPEWCPL